MKNVLYKSGLTMMLFYSSTLCAQDWKTMGDPVTLNNKMAMSIGQNGKIFTAYNNTMNGLNVKSFDGSKWVQLGKTDFTEAWASIFDITTDKNGTPYVAYRCIKRGTNIERAWVEKFDGKEWVKVGSDAISVGSINDITLAFDNNNTLLCAFADHKRQKLAVMKFEGGNWTELASPQDMATCSELTLKFSQSNVPFLCYADTKNGKKVTVKSFNGTQWTLIGNNTVSDKEGRYVNMELDSKGNPVVAYQYTWDGSILAHKFDGKAWVKLGDAIFTGSNDNISLAIDAQDAPIVAYHVNKDKHPIEVKKFDGENWDKLSDAGMGKHYTTLLSNQDALYINFQESDRGGVVKQLIK